MKQNIDGRIFDVIPWEGGKLLYCYYLNQKVPRFGNQKCCRKRNNNADCIDCSLSSEYLFAEHQDCVDKGIAMWITTEDGERLAVQINEYGLKHRKI